MKKQKLHELVKEFAVQQSGAFEFKELMKFVRRKEKGFDDQRGLFSAALDSEWLFADYSVLDKELFMPRHCFFKGAEFLVKPLPEEVEGGYLVPGHRMMPFIARAKEPFEATLKQADGSVITTRRESFVGKEVMKYLLFYGNFGMISYLVDDDATNGDHFVPPYEERVNLTVFEMQEFFARSGFKAGDSLMLTVEDWLEGVYSMRHIPSKGVSVDFEASHNWCQALRKGFEEVYEEDEINYDCYEQAALMFWLAALNGSPSLLSEPPLSFSAFFNLQKDLTIKTMGQLSFFWPKDEPLENRMRDLLEDGGPEPETELEAFFQLLGLSMDSEDAEAYMRDALAHGINDPEIVLKRVISGRSLLFPSDEDQAEFQQLWQELWDEVRGNYDKTKDPLREMRSVFLGLNDQCMRVLREMDQSGIDPYDLIGSPDIMQLGEISAMVHHALIAGNSSEAEEFPGALDELSQNLSAIIEDLASRLCTGPIAKAKAPASGSVYQLKISLKYSKPLIWRRVLVPAAIELEDLHDVIQVVFGWEDCHLHQFIDGRTRYQEVDAEQEMFGMMRDVVDSDGVQLRSLLRKAKDKIVYEYDFGDSWEHEIVLEKVLKSNPKQQLPLCVKGKLACPPEDCGGLPGYYNLLETFAGPDSEEKEEMLEWCCDPIDPEAFDLDAINERLEEWF